jgi:glycosyltransferase involved in cell wall biosynthesis
MHIAWLGKKSPFCGNVTYGREVTNALLDRGYKVSFLHFAQESSTLDPSSECSEVSLPFIYKSQIYTIPSPRSSKVLTKALQDLKPDLVHASLTLSPLDFLLPEICEELGLPLISTFHPPFDPKPRNLTSGTQHLMYQLYAPFLAHYNRVIIFSQIQRDLLVRLGVPEERIAVIPNGVDIQRYSPGPSKIKAVLKAQRLFVYQGRVSTEKNIESLLKAWKQVKLGPDCKLIIVGDGPLKLTLEPFYGSKHGIIWWGFESDENQRIDILRGSDVFILPSLVEGLSLSLLEAMACGIACVATEVGADREALEGEAGITIQPQGVSSQLRILLPLLRDQPTWTTLLGQKARQRTLERYSLTQNISLLEKLYVEVLGQHQSYFNPHVGLSKAYAQK